MKFRAEYPATPADEIDKIIAIRWTIKKLRRSARIYAVPFAELELSLGWHKTARNTLDYSTHIYKERRAEINPTLVFVQNPIRWEKASLNKSAKQFSKGNIDDIRQGKIDQVKVCRRDYRCVKAFFEREVVHQNAALPQKQIEYFTQMSRAKGSTIVDLHSATGQISRLETLLAFRIQVRRHVQARINHSGHAEEVFGSWCCADKEKIRLADLLALADHDSYMYITCDNCYASHFVLQAAQMQAKDQLQMDELVITCFSASDSLGQWEETQALYN